MVRRKPNKFWDGLHWLFVVFIMGPIVHIGYVLLLIAFEIHSLIKKIWIRNVRCAGKSCHSVSLRKTRLCVAITIVAKFVLIKRRLTDISARKRNETRWTQPLASFYFPRNDLKKIYWVKIILFFVTSIIIVVYWSLFSAVSKCRYDFPEHKNPIHHYNNIGNKK